MAWTAKVALTPDRRKVGDSWMVYAPVTFASDEPGVEAITATYFSNTLTLDELRNWVTAKIEALESTDAVFEDVKSLTPGTPIQKK